MSSSPGLPSQEYESSELANFRAEWRAELESRKRARQASASTTNIVEHALYLTPRPLQQTRKPTLVAQSHPVITSSGEIIGEKQGKALTSALSVYKQAIQFEQAGDLDQALTLYKQAFRMVSQFLFDFQFLDAREYHMSIRTHMSIVHFIVKRCCSILRCSNLGRRSRHHRRLSPSLPTQPRMTWLHLSGHLP